MPADDWERLRDLFHAALERSRNERMAFLDEACGGDARVRAQIGAMVEAHEQTASLDEPVASRAGDGDPAKGLRVGRYEVRRTIATGGMGTVYEATQDQPRRLVALKVLRRGAASRQALKRFRYESEILGRLRHPNIAQVYDAGTYDEGEGGQPYFAMELVKGRRLLQFCAAKDLNTHQRLELFAKICDAVQFAHHKGVIHRDLKPDNILVDDFGEPKILDFGVARATDSDIQATTLQTDIGQLIGTVPYMSPEQVAGDPAELDTRSDVYSLGVVLYELLADRLPHDLRDKSIPEAVRIIGEQDPTPLSSISRIYRGDLDTITAKALEKEKDRRYQTVTGLAADIRRYLADEPVVARPASTFYKLRKFSRRNRAVVAGVATVIVVLAAGTVISSILAIGQARARADAQHQADVAEAVNAFLIDDMLNVGDPKRERGGLTIVNMLDEASEKIEGRFEDEPLVESAIRLAFGWAYYRLGNLTDALPHVEEAYELSLEARGEDDAVTRRAKFRVGAIYWRLGRYAEAEHLLSDLVEQRRGLPDERYEYLRSVGYLGVTYRRLHRYGEAETLGREAYEGARDLLGEENWSTLVYMQSLGTAYVVMGRYEEAESLLKRSLEIRTRRYGEKHRRTAQAMLALGECYVYQDRFDEAEPLVREAVACYQQTLPENHYHLPPARELLGRVLLGQGRKAEYEALMRELEGVDVVPE
jgi:tetratricopeptide (TPR) repeat protein